MDSFSEERNPDQKRTWNWVLSLPETFFINVKCTTTKSEIIRKGMVLERVEINLLKYSHY